MWDNQDAAKGLPEKSIRGAIVSILAAQSPKIEPHTAILYWSGIGISGSRFILRSFMAGGADSQAPEISFLCCDNHVHNCGLCQIRRSADQNTT